MFRTLLLAFVGIFLTGQMAFAKQKSSQYFVVSPEIYKSLTKTQKGQVIEQFYKTLVDLETAYNKNPKAAAATPGFIDRLQALRSFFISNAYAGDLEIPAVEVNDSWEAVARNAAAGTRTHNPQPPTPEQKTAIIASRAKKKMENGIPLDVTELRAVQEVRGRIAIREGRTPTQSEAEAVRIADARPLVSSHTATTTSATQSNLRSRQPLRTPSARNLPGNPFVPPKGTELQSTCIYGGWSIKAALYGGKEDYCSEHQLPAEAKLPCGNDGTKNTNQIACNPAAFPSEEPVCVFSAFYLKRTTRDTNTKEFRPTADCVAAMRKKYGGANGEIDFTQVADAIEKKAGGVENFLSTLNDINGTCGADNTAKLQDPLKRDVEGTCKTLRAFTDNLMKQLVQNRANKIRSDEKTIIAEGNVTGNLKVSGGPVSASASVDANMNINVTDLINGSNIINLKDFDDVARSLIVPVKAQPQQSPTPNENQNSCSKDSNGNMCCTNTAEIPGKFYCKAHVIDKSVPDALAKFGASDSSYHIAVIEGNAVKFYSAANETGPFCESNKDLSLGNLPKSEIDKLDRITNDCPTYSGDPKYQLKIPLTKKADGKSARLILSRNVDSTLCNLDPDKRGLGWGGGKFKKLQVETFMPGQGMKQLYEGVVRVRDGVAPAGSKTEQTVAVVTKIMSDRKNLRYDSFQRKSPGARPERQTNIVCGTQPLEIDEALKFYSTLDYCGSEVKFKVEYVQHVEPANKDVGAYCQSPIDGPTSQPSFGLKQIDPTYDVYICSSENAGGEPIVLSYKTLRGVVTSGDYVKRFLNADEKSRLCGKSPSTNAKLPYNAPITGGAPAAQ